MSVLPPLLELRSRVQTHRQFGCTEPGSPPGKSSVAPTIMPSLPRQIGQLRRSSVASQTRRSSSTALTSSALARPVLNDSDVSVVAMRSRLPSVAAFVAAAVALVVALRNQRSAKLEPTRRALEKSRTVSSGSGGAARTTPSASASTISRSMPTARAIWRDSMVAAETALPTRSAVSECERPSLELCRRASSRRLRNSRRLAASSVRRELLVSSARRSWASRLSCRRANRCT